MKQLLIPLSAVHYFKTRRSLWIKFLIAFIPALTVWLCLRFIDIRVDAITGKPFTEFNTVFSDFVNVQISAIAILISFSIAIITILVSADNSSIKKLKTTASSDCKPLRNKPLSLHILLESVGQMYCTFLKDADNN